MIIELSLGVKDPDCVQVFFEGYEKAKAADTKKVLLEVLGVVCKSLRQPDPVDAEFLEQSKQWCLANRTRVKVNPFYAPYSLSPHRTEFFVPKG